MYDVVVIGTGPAGLTAATNTSLRGLMHACIGFEPTRSFLENNGLELREKGAVKVHRNLQTNIKGVFAAGDVTGEVRIIAVACAEGIVAAVHAFEDIKKPYWLH